MAMRELIRQVKKSLDEAEKAGGKEANKKNVVQKVSYSRVKRSAEADNIRRYLTSWSLWLILELSRISLPRGK